MLLGMATKKAPAESPAGAEATDPAPSDEQPELTGALIHLPESAAPDPPADPRRSDVDAWGRSEHMRELARRAFQPFYDRWFRVEWDGLEKIPTDGGALLVANHAGAIPTDAPVIMHGIETELQRAVYGLADNMFRDLPFVGTLWSRAGGVPAHPDNAYRLLREQGELTLVFPEGTKGTGKLMRDRYRLRRFGRGGYVEIAMRAGVPIVPIAVVGSEEAMPIVMKFPNAARAMGIPYLPLTVNMLLGGPLGVLPLPAKFRVQVLDPIHFDVEPDQLRYSKSRIMDASEHIRERIQEALFEMLRARNSPWFG